MSACYDSVSLLDLSRAVLHPLRDDARMLAFLRAHPLGILESSALFPEPDWMGYFDPLQRNLVINAVRPLETFGQDQPS
jgi:hypothetical protein